MFRKSNKELASTMFKKGLSTGSNVSKMFGKASSTLGGAVNKGNQILGAVENVPFVKTAIEMNPEAQGIVSGIRKGLKAGGNVSSILSKTSDIINPLNYEKITTKSGGVNLGKVQKNVNTGLQRAKDIEKEGRELYNFVR